MRCKAVRNRLDRFSRQELTPRARKRIEAHLSGCADCRQHLASHERLAVLLTNLPRPQAVPEGFGNRLLAAARERQAVRRPVPGSLWRPRWLSPPASVGRKAAQAVALAGGLLIGVSWASKRGGLRIRPSLNRLRSLIRLPFINWTI